MSIETQQQFVGRTKALLFTETQSERYMSWVRLGTSIFYGIILVYSLIKGGIPPRVFYAQTGALIFLFLYSVYALVWLHNRFVRNYIAYVFVFLDVSIISVIVATYLWGQNVHPALQGTLFSIYFIAITFTAMHNSMALSIFCGLLSALGYVIVHTATSRAVGHPATGGIVDMLFRIGLLLIVAVLSGIISRNNFKTVQRVVSSEIRYQNLVHRLPEMLFTLDGNKCFLWANRAAYSILGIPAKVIRGRNVEHFLINPGEFRLDEEGMEKTIVIKDFNGNRKFVDCVIHPAGEADEASWEGRMVDTTDRELALNQREEMVARLFEYQKMESLGTLASGMAHDFNNILQTLNQIASMVESDTAEQETRKQMGVISDTITDARFLISELLALGSKTPLSTKPLNLQEFVKKTVALYREQIGSSFEILVQMPQEPVFVKGDPDYLKRVFQNLFGNARDAMGERGVITIHVFTQNNNLDEPSVIIRFSDTGNGIPPGVLDKIFDPFFTTKKPGKGTGLGLALVRRIITLHNGNIFVEKTDRHGTIFRIEMPQSDSAEIDDDTKEILKNRYTTTVLLLDDDPKIRDILKFFIRELGYGVCEASNCGEARRELGKNAEECEVVIMDWRLGREDPRRVIAALRAIAPEVIIIVVSGYPPQQAAMEEMGIHRWLTKPYNKNQLDFEIQKALYLTHKKK